MLARISASLLGDRISTSSTGSGTIRPSDGAAQVTPKSGCATARACGGLSSKQVGTAGPPCPGQVVRQFEWAQWAGCDGSRHRILLSPLWRIADPRRYEPQTEIQK